jgi:hypothetical protein
MPNRNEGGNVYQKYTNAYEQKLDPFSKFNYEEKRRRYANLKLHEKFSLQFGSFILSNQWARLIFFVYFLVVHLLIFGVFYFFAHSDANHRDFSAECARSFKNHMKEVHGDEKFKLDDHFH